MTDTEYTKGPWVLVQDEKWPFGFTIKAGDFPVIVASRYSTGSNQSSIAENRDAVGFDADEREVVRQGNLTQDANLRMATASPDMYEALQCIMRDAINYDDITYQHIRKSKATAEAHDRLAAGVRKAKAALSKAHPSAEGE